MVNPLNSLILDKTTPGPRNRNALLNQLGLSRGFYSRLFSEDPKVIGHLALSTVAKVKKLTGIDLVDYYNKLS